jgi:hypothetical protein
VAALAAQVDRLTGHLAEREEASAVQGMGVAPADRLRVSLGRTGLDQVEAALEAMIAGGRPPDGVPPLSGIREFYHLLSGDYAMTGLFDGERVYLANVNSSTMANMVANALNKVIVN